MSEEKENNHHRQEPPGDTPRAGRHSQGDDEKIHSLEVRLIDLEVRHDELKQQRETLEKSLDGYRKVIESAPAAFFTLDRYNVIEEINASCTRLLGLEPEAILKKKFTSFIAPEDTGHYYRYRRSAMRRENAVSYRLRLVSAERESFPAELTLLNTGSGRMMISALEIPGEWRKQSELDFYSRLLDSVGESIITLDPKGCIIYWGKGAENMLGWRSAEVRGKKIQDVLRLDPVSLYGEAENNGQRQTECPVKHMDGHEMYLSFSITAAREPDGSMTYTAIGRDATRRRMTEQQLLIKGAAIHSAINGIFITELSGYINYVNRSFLRMLRYRDESEILGCSGSVLFDDRETARTIRRVADDTGHWQGETRLKTRSGDALDVMFSANLVTGDDGKPICVMGSFYDISGRKQMEAELETYREQLEELVVERTRQWREANHELEKRMAESIRAEDRIRSLTNRLMEAQEKEARRIGQDLHDIVGSSLTVLKLAIHEARKRLPEEYKDLLIPVDELTVNLAQQVRSLSHSMRMSELENATLTEALYSYFENLENQTGTEVDFSHNDIPEPLPKNAEITLFRIIQEALNNVVKHSGVQKASVSLQYNGNELELRIEDRGKGFDPVQVPGNTGGIPGMSDRAILAGGKLEIESAPGSGTRIACSIPAGPVDRKPFDKRGPLP